MLKLISDILEEIGEGQKIDLRLVDWLVSINQGQGGDFKIDENGVIRFRDRVCVSYVLELKKSILEEGHMSGLSIHPNVTKMYQDPRKMFWWPGMKKEIVEFVYACLTCQKSKVEHQKMLGLMQPLYIPEWKWDNIMMDFMCGLPRTVNNCDTIWVIVDRLAKPTHFILIQLKYPLERLSELYIEKIVNLHGIPSSIIFDKYLRFMSRFWGSLHKALGKKVHLSSFYHPRIDGQIDRTIQSLKDLLEACVLEQEGNWDNFLPLIEFIYNKSFHFSIGMEPFEALYGRRCMTPLCWYESGKGVMIGPDIVQQITEKIKVIQEKRRSL